jgi:hypothetical protein
LNNKQSEGNGLINIGTPEKPIWIPQQALDIGSGGEEWWQMYANGSATLSEEVLPVLLEHIETQGTQGDEKS